MREIFLVQGGKYVNQIGVKFIVDIRSKHKAQK